MKRVQDTMENINKEELGARWSSHFLVGERPTNRESKKKKQKTQLRTSTKILQQSRTKPKQIRGSPKHCTVARIATKTLHCSNHKLTLHCTVATKNSNQNTGDRSGEVQNTGGRLQLRQIKHPGQKTTADRQGSSIQQCRLQQNTKFSSQIAAKQIPKH